MSKAIVAKIERVIEIPNATNVQVGIVLGENVVISKDTPEGTIGILFPAETQLSEDYCKYNNLYRDKSLNINPEKSGFFDANRKVRAQPFLKIRSTAYFAPLDSMFYISHTCDATSAAKYLYLGASFDNIEGVEICRKYISKATQEAINKAAKSGVKQAKKTYAPFFEKHVDSSQFKHNVHMIEKGSLLSFHAKIHGSSQRCAFTKVMLTLPKWKETINKFCLKAGLNELFPSWKWDYVVGTRNVVLTSSDKEGFHGSEQFRYDVLNTLIPYMKKSFSFYGEIAGFANNKPIMAKHLSKDTKNKEFQKKYGNEIIYKYNCKEHEYRFHIYRIAYTTEDGEQIDLSQKQLEYFCEKYNFIPPFEIAPQEIYDGDVQKLIEKVNRLTEREDCLCEDYVDSSIPSEGIIVRVDNKGMKPVFLKNKSFHFKTMEGLCESVDVEDAS